MRAVGNRLGCIEVKQIISQIVQDADAAERRGDGGYMIRKRGFCDDVYATERCGHWDKAADTVRIRQRQLRAG